MTGSTNALQEGRWRDRSSARALLLTLLGEFAARPSHPVPTRTFVDSLALLGVGEANARQALARSAARGWLTPSRAGRETLYRPTGDMRRLLEEGAARIYDFGRTPPGDDSQWLLLHVQISDDTSATVRARLARRLRWAGFGTPGGSLWLSPDSQREGLATSVLDDLALSSATSTLRGRPSGLAGLEPMVGRAWDLDSVARRYESFLQTFRDPRPRRPEEVFAALANLVHEWRNFPFIDPCLPPSYLPRHWPGPRAARRFLSLRSRWAPTAQRWWSQRISDKTDR